MIFITSSYFARCRAWAFFAPFMTKVIIMIKSINMHCKISNSRLRQSGICSHNTRKSFYCFVCFFLFFFLGEGGVKQMLQIALHWFDLWGIKLYLLYCCYRTYFRYVGYTFTAINRDLLQNECDNKTLHTKNYGSQVSEYNKTFSYTRKLNLII